MPTTKTFLLPDLGEGLTEADLLSWLVSVGDAIALNQVFAEVETVKASVELPSPYAGTVVALHAGPGDSVKVGEPLIEIAVAGDRDEGASESPGERTRTPVLVGYGVAEEPTSRRRTRIRPGKAVGAPDATPTPRRERRPLATPPIRFAARQRGIDLAEVSPTGVHGEVTRDDLDRHAEADAQSAGPPDRDGGKPAAVFGAEDRTPISGVRKHTAAAMVRSAFTAPHVTEFVTVDVTETVELIDRLRQSQDFTDVRLTALTLVAKALLVALRSHPTLNSSWDDERQEIVVKRYVNLGIAAATPRGLMVPNVKGAQTLALRDLAIALSALTATAKAGKTGPADLVGGTITITNIGVFGIDSGTPILNPGEAAILGFGAIRPRPWEYRGEVALRSVTTLSLSFDHRLVDGEQGSTFLATIARVLSDPLALLALS